MRKSNALLFMMLFVSVTVCCPTKVASQDGISSEKPQPTVTEGKLLQRVEPVYPPFAKLARITGTVVLQAVIAKDGLLKSIRVVSGPPILQQAAIDAVKQWKYQPYLLGGEPVEVETTLNIGFSLGATTPPQQNQAATQPTAVPVQSNSSSSDPTEPKAQEELGEEFANGTNGHPQDDTQAVYWFRKAAEKGYAIAQYYLGTMYEKGLGGLPKDDSQAVYWYKKAGEQGNESARAALVRLFLEPPLQSQQIVVEKGPNPTCPKGTHRVPGSDSGISYVGTYVMWSAAPDISCVWYRCEEDDKIHRCAVLHQRRICTRTSGSIISPSSANRCVRKRIDQAAGSAADHAAQPKNSPLTRPDTQSNNRRRRDRFSTLRW